MKTLSPNLVIKVIDACQSGTTYIKESNILNKYFTASKESFKKCYFLNSSMNNQSSYQDKEISHFTLSFLNSLKEHTADEIRYKDIIDVISDEFSDNQEQTPFFVIQADYTEKFCAFSKNLRDFLNKFNNKKSSKQDEKNTPMSIYDLVKLDAKEYIDKDGAIKAVGFIGEQFEKIKLQSDLSELFDVKINLLEDYQSIQKLDVIEKWLLDHPNDYFATSIQAWTYDPEDGEEYPYIAGFDLKVDLPYKAISIEFNSKFPNLPSYHSNVMFLLSKKLIRFFYFITNYTNESWDNKILNVKDLKWVTGEYKIADNVEISKGIKRIINSFHTRLENDIREKFKVSAEKEDIKESSNKK